MKKDKAPTFIRDKDIPLDSAVTFKNVSFFYEKERPCLKNISFDIKRGEFISIIGHNGSGKSTLSKLIDGILAQNEGDIYIFGVKMQDNNAIQLRKDIALVFQNPDSQFIGATCRDDIAFGLENMQVKQEDMEEIIDDCLRKVGMEEYKDAEPANLSGGQKQRIAIASALARKPKILILDEASAMLDPKGKKEIEDIIFERKKEDKDLTIINITHEIDETINSDRVLVLSKGNLVMSDTPNKVFANDEFLTSIHLSLPFDHLLVKELNKLGYKIEYDDHEGLIEKICR